MTQLILGTERPDEETLEVMRERGGEWFAYQNVDLGHPELGHLRFLKCGAGCTFKEAPERHPDSPEAGICWRYLLVGSINLETGDIEPEVIA